MSTNKTQPNPNSDVSNVMNKLNEISNKISITSSNTNSVENHIQEQLTVLDKNVSSIAESLAKQREAEDPLNKDDVANAFSILGEHIVNLQLQVTNSIEVSTKTTQKIEPLENYLITMVKAITTLYERNNELKALQLKTISKLDKLTEIITSLAQQDQIENSLEGKLLKHNDLQDTVNQTVSSINNQSNQSNQLDRKGGSQEVKTSLFTKVKNLFAFIPRLKPN